MMKFFQPVLLAATVLLAACSDSAPQSRIDVVKQMQEALASVEDTATANAAADKFYTLATTLESFPETDEADADRAEHVCGELLEEAKRIQKAEYFNSEALKNALMLTR